MPFEINYEFQETGKMASEWRLWVPVPTTAKEAGEAVEKIFALKGKTIILVTVNEYVEDA